MNPQIAIELINALISAEVDIVRQSNFRSTGPTLTALRAERKAIIRIFESLTDRPPTPEELTEMAAS